MTTTELERWAPDFAGFHTRFARFFSRSEPRAAAQRYVRGLLAPMPRKNCWQLAETLGDADPQALQRLLYATKWDAEAVQAELQQFVVSEFGHPEAIGVLDESSFAKKGEHSVGVKRQWCGTLGKKENCQRPEGTRVFLAYVSPRGYAFLDRRLYLPEEWAQDTRRRRAAQVPDTIGFRTKGVLGQEMLERAWERGVPMRWITGDEAYGDLPYLRERIAAEYLLYVLAVSSNTHAWTDNPGTKSPGCYTFGRPRKHPRLAPGAPPSQPVAALVAAWPAARWQRLAIAAGEKGPRVYDWGAARIVIRKGKLPGEELWLLARRSIEKPEELAYYLSNAPAATPLLTLAQVAGARWRIEQAFEEAKGEAGLDEYEVRYWQSWHRHITLSLLAHSWLTSIRRQARQRERGEKGSPGTAPDAVGTGRTHGGRGATAAGDGLAPATAECRVPAGLVALAAIEASAGTLQSLPPAWGSVPGPD